MAVHVETVRGTSPSGAARQLDCWTDDEGKLALWVHSPGSERNGWEIHVTPAELEAALSRLNRQRLDPKA